MADLTRAGWAFARVRLMRVLAYALPVLIFALTIEPLPRSKGRDLFPFPDANEYALLAHAMAKGDPPLIAAGHQLYPSRYPIVVPAMFVPVAWLTGNHLQRIWWASALYALLSIVMIVRVGTWITGSRWAGSLGAALWGMHMETVSAAMHCMTETATVFLLMATLEIARPWLAREKAEQGGERPARVLRAGLLGLALGLCMLAKAPLLYLTVALTLTVLWDARGDLRRLWREPAAAAAGVLFFYAADSAYRQWAFGDWRLNGYSYWDPGSYAEMARVLNVSFLFTPFNPAWEVGNATYLWRMFSGQTHEYFYPPMAALGLASVIALCVRALRHAGSRRMLMLMGSWCFSIIAFTAIYFWQSARFLLFCAMMLDLTIAWAILRVLYARRLGRARVGGVRIAPWVRGAAFVLIVGLVGLKGRRDQQQFHENFPFATNTPYVDQLMPLLEEVPEGALLLTNYQLPLVQVWRPQPGPTAALYVHLEDCTMMNPMLGGIEAYRPRPRAIDPAWSERLPASWRNRAALLIDMQARWRLTEAERAALVAQQPYVLIVEPLELPIAKQYYETQIRPMLEGETQMDLIGRNQCAALYRMRAR